jgi:serine/threonine protein kinase
MFHAAVATPAAERAAFLSAECGSDAGLRVEVDSLLAAHREGQTDVRPGAVGVGSRLGDYEVTRFIAAGGMGEVYQARDTKLGREVAIKILPRAFASDSEPLARFEREARVLASLNHPNIATIHGIEESDGIRALVMELVEGPTLAHRIAQGPVPLDEALAIATQIAEALEAGHEKGIVHRDLKPANIKVRSDGTVKVLDFGLAKALARDPSNTAVSQSSTITSPGMTRPGVILGTPAYMSPEQVRGDVADRRADIWAFGCVLYEMLTARRTFEDENVSLTLANVLRRDPDFDALPANTPPRVIQTLRRCLQKDPKQRVHAIADVRLAMQGAFETSTPQPETSRPAVRIWQRPWMQPSAPCWLRPSVDSLSGRPHDRRFLRHAWRSSRSRCGPKRWRRQRPITTWPSRPTAPMWCIEPRRATASSWPYERFTISTHDCLGPPRARHMVRSCLPMEPGSVSATRGMAR